MNASRENSIKLQLNRSTTTLQKKTTTTRSSSFGDDFSFTCLIREVIVAPLCPNSEVAKLLEIALMYHNSCQYHQSIQVYIMAQQQWMDAELEPQRKALEERVKERIQQRENELMLAAQMTSENPIGGVVTAEAPKPTEVSSEPISEPIDPIQEEYEQELAELTERSNHGEFMPPRAQLYFRLVIGNVYESAGNDEMALTEYMEAKRIADEIVQSLDSTTDDSPRSTYGSRPQSRSGLPSQNAVPSLFTKEELERKSPQEIELLRETTTPYYSIGCVYLHMKQYSLSYRYFMKCKEMRSAILQTDHVDVASLDNNIGVSLFYMNRMEEALDSFEKAHKVLSALFGENHSRCLITKKNISVTRRKISLRL